jgi:hypothetical protein
MRLGGMMLSRRFARTRAPSVTNQQNFQALSFPCKTAFRERLRCHINASPIVPPLSIFNLRSIWSVPGDISWI